LRLVGLCRAHLPGSAFVLFAHVSSFQVSKKLNKNGVRKKEVEKTFLLSFDNRLGFFFLAFPNAVSDVILRGIR
jgi:hypothetical protein